MTNTAITWDDETKGHKEIDLDEIIEEQTSHISEMVGDAITGQIPEMIDDKIADQTPNLINNAITNQVPSMITSGINEQTPSIITESILQQTPLLIQQMVPNIVSGQIDNIPDLIDTSITNLVPSMIQSAIEEKIFPFIHTLDKNLLLKPINYTRLNVATGGDYLKNVNGVRTYSSGGSVSRELSNEWSSNGNYSFKAIFGGSSATEEMGFLGNANEAIPVLSGDEIEFKIDYKSAEPIRIGIQWRTEDFTYLSQPLQNIPAAPNGGTESITATAPEDAGLMMFTVRNSNPPEANTVFVDNIQVITDSEIQSDEDPFEVKGYYINPNLTPNAINVLTVASLEDDGITDLFVLTNKDNVAGTLGPWVTKFGATDIRIHAWVTCFRDSGSWYDPGTNPDLVSQLKTSLLAIANNNNIDGINLDSLRYPGTAYLHDGTTHVTNFTEDLYDEIQAINEEGTPNKPKIKLSASVMAEGASGTAYYYGQSYSQLSDCLDFFLPMIYKGNYVYPTGWVGTATAEIVAASGNTPVVSTLLTYRSDADPTPIPLSELEGDIQLSRNNGSSGYALFRYGLIHADAEFLTINQIANAASSVKSYYTTNDQLPTVVSMGTGNYTMAQLLYLLTTATINVNLENTSSIAARDVNDPPVPTPTSETGNIVKADVISHAEYIQNFIVTNGRALNQREINGVLIGFVQLVLMYSDTIAFYQANNRLPNYTPLVT